MDQAKVSQRRSAVRKLRNALDIICELQDMHGSGDLPLLDSEPEQLAAIRTRINNVIGTLSGNRLS